MTKHLSRRILLLFTLYVCIIFGILAVQFTNGNAFSLSIDSLMVTGTMETGESGKEHPVLPLHVAVNGLDFFLDEDNPLLAYDDGARAIPLKLSGIDKRESSVTLRFSGNVTVTFAPEKRGDADRVTISASIPVKYQKITFPYRIARSARIEKKDTLTLIGLGKKQYSFTGAQAQPSAGLALSAIRHLAIPSASPSVCYQTWIPAKGLSVAALSDLPGSSAADWQRAVEQYAANALVSFKDSVAGGNFSEPLVAAYIAEMGRIGMYQAAIESIPESYRNGSGRTYLTNTFLNNLEKTWGGFVAREREDRSMLSRRLTESNPAVFEFPGLVPYLVDRGSAILLDDIVRIASSIDMANVSALQAAGILEASADCAKYAPERASALEALDDSCERKITASLVRVGDDLYISEDGKTVDTRETFRVASALINYGASSPARDPWKSAGHLLVTSLLGFVGNQSALPAQFTLAGDDSGEKTGLVAQSDQMISPSVAYPLLVTGNTWYPHTVSLASQAGPGVWAWTSARSLQVTKPSADSMRITASFPQGDTHYMVIRGIKPFRRIQIYGMDFRTDPRFESYNSSGYRYDAETGTLFLKMRHKAEYEDVMIWFGSPSSGDSGALSSGALGDQAEAPAEAANP